MIVHIVAVDSDNLAGLLRHIATLPHIIEIDLFVFQHVHHIVDELECLFGGFGVVDDAGGDDVHALDVAEFGV